MNTNNMTYTIMNSKTKVNKLLNKIRLEITEELILKIKELELKDEEKILEALNTQENKKPKRKAPKIPKESRCTQLTKKGTPCPVAKCAYEKCWAHMSKSEKEEYRKLKK